MTPSPYIFNILQTASPSSPSSLALTGSEAVIVPHNGPPLSSQFSLELTFAQSAGTTGYLLTKADAQGNRYFALFSAAPDKLYFFYAAAGGSVSTINYVRFITNIADGHQHHLLLAVNDTQVALYVDWLPVGTPALLVGPVQDCGAASPTCILMLGGRPGPTPSYFTGTITEVMLYSTQALAWLPTTMAPSTAAAITTTTPGNERERAREGGREGERKKEGGKDKKKEKTMMLDGRENMWGK